MYDKKYRITSIRDSFTYHGLEGKICCPVYLKVGEPGWFVCDTEGYNDRIDTSPVQDVEYTDNQIIVKTEDTIYTFTAEEEEEAMEYPTKRNLDGVYFRVKRDGEWCNVCFTDMTREEQDKVMEGRSNEWLKAMCKNMADIIHQLGDNFDLSCDEW